MKASHCTEIPAGTALTVRVAQPHEVVAFDAQLASQCLGAALRALPGQRREHFGWGGVEVRNPWRRDALLGEDGSRSRNANLLANAAFKPQDLARAPGRTPSRPTPASTSSTRELEFIPKDPARFSFVIRQANQRMHQYGAWRR